VRAGIGNENSYRPDVAAGARTRIGRLALGRGYPGAWCG
jgi:hypothetical protein